MEKARVMLIDDNIQNVERFKKEFLEKYEIFISKSIEDAEEVMQNIDNIAVVISDYNINSINGIVLFEKIKNLFHDSIRILVTSYKDFDVAVEAVNRCYIFRYHLIPWQVNVLAKSIGDAVELYWKQKDLYTRAISDSLTGLLNRTRMMEKVEMEVSRSLRYGVISSVVMIDIDHFKLVNDQYGHQVGDLVIKELSDIFVDEVRDVDSVGRYGGEEFILLLPETPAENAKVLCERIRKRVEETDFMVDGLVVTISSGIAGTNKEDDSLTVIKKADIALYKAKDSGRNRVELS